MTAQRPRCFQYLAACLMILLSGTTPASADDASTFPTRAIRIIVAFGAGGPPDTVARLVASGLERKLGKPVIVENLSGASGALAAKAAARAPADGYTLMVVDMSFIVARHVVANFDIEPLKAFRSVGQAARAPFAFIASSTLPVSNIADFVKLAKDQPEAIIIGHTGIGTTPYLGALAFSDALSIKPRLVPYRIVADATNNAMAGIISGVFSAATTAVGVRASDKVKILGVTGDTRVAVLPDVPTFAESGIKMRGFEQGAWYGVVAPQGTPNEIVTKLNAALNELMQDEVVKARVAATGVEFKSGTPEEFHALMAEQDAFWSEALKAAGATPSGK